jgi:hypothetical protein
VRTLSLALLLVSTGLPAGSEPARLNPEAPLRLVIPVKYGIKNIKCIGTLRFTHGLPVHNRKLTV